MLILLVLLAAGARPAPSDRPPDRLPPGPAPAFLREWPEEPAAGFSLRFPDESLRPEAHYYGALARDVRERVDPFLPHPIFGEPILALLPTPEDFVEVTGIVEHRSPAAASGQPPVVYLNLVVLRGMARHEQEKTLAHELAHVFLGRHARARLPLWLEEGIAMAVEGQGADHLALAWARTAGGLPALRTLTGSFPAAGPARSLAYGMSRSVVDFLIDRDYPGTGLRGLLADLVDPTRGAALIERYHTPLLLDGIEREWRATYTVRAALLLLFTDDTVHWIFLALFAAVCYLVLIVRRRRRLREMEAAENVPRAPSLFPAGAGRPGFWHEASAGDTRAAEGGETADGEAGAPPLDASPPVTAPAPTSGERPAV